MRSYHHYYRHQAYQAIHSDFWRLELSIWLQTLAWSLMAIFVPVLMLNYGYSLGAVIAYEIVFYGIDVPLNFLAREMILRWGAREVTIVGIICAMIFALCFHYLSLGGYAILFGLAVLHAFFDAFYWVGHFYLFIESSGKPEMAGRNTGILNGVRILGGMLGPAIGAGILIMGGQEILLGVGACIFAFSLVPLFALQHVRNKPARRVPFKEFMWEWREKRSYISFGLYCIHAAAEDPMWPIFIFITFGTLNSVALLAVVVSVSTIALSYATGVLTQRSAVTLISVGGLCTAGVWILRLLIPNPLVYYASVLVIGFFAILVHVPIESGIVEHGRAKDALWAATMRNTSSMLAPFFLFLILAPLVLVFKISFAAAALSLIVLVFLMRLVGTATIKTV